MQEKLIYWIDHDELCLSVVGRVHRATEVVGEGGEEFLRQETDITLVSPDLNSSDIICLKRMNLEKEWPTINPICFY